MTGAVLLASGKRKAGLAVAAAGTIFALVEDPDGVKKVWNNIPDYLDNGHSMLSRFEKFVGELTSQGEKLRPWSKKWSASKLTATSQATKLWTNSPMNLARRSPGWHPRLKSPQGR